MARNHSIVFPCAQIAPHMVINHQLCVCVSVCRLASMRAWHVCAVLCHSVCVALLIWDCNIYSAYCFRFNAGALNSPDLQSLASHPHTHTHTRARSRKHKHTFHYNANRVASGMRAKEKIHKNCCAATKHVKQTPRRWRRLDWNDDDDNKCARAGNFMSFEKPSTRQFRTNGCVSLPIRAHATLYGRGSIWSASHAANEIPINPSRISKSIFITLTYAIRFTFIAVS